FAGRYPYKLVRRGGQRHLDLQPGVVAQAAEHNGAHFVAEALEAAELVERGALSAPEERVSVVRQLMTEGAKLEGPFAAMIGEVTLNDAILKHAAERKRDAAGRPGEFSRDHDIG